MDPGTPKGPAATRPHARPANAVKGGGGNNLTDQATPKWEGLSPPYSTIVADPPWQYETTAKDGTKRRVGGGGTTAPRRARDGYTGPWFNYSQLPLEDIKAIPVGDLVVDGRLFLWTTNRYLRHAWDVVEAWGFTPQLKTLVWCKTPMATTPITTEFVLIAKRGNPPVMPWSGTTWYQWPNQSQHSRKPAAFYDLVESWCPGPYVDLFSRAPRLGWDSWGLGYESERAS